MAIARSGTFDYSVVVERAPGTPPRWVGQAHSLRDGRDHPGLVGKQPLFELANGQIILRASESKVARLANRKFRMWGQPADAASYEVGNIPGVVVEAGDRIAFHKHGTGDFALTIIRQESLILGVGSISELPLGRDLQVEEDARIKELRLYELAGYLARFDGDKVQVAWFEMSKDDPAPQLELLRRAPPCRLLVVGFKPGRLHWKAMNNLLRQAFDSMEADIKASYEVDSRFSTMQDWLDYVRQLPTTYPDDLRLSFATGHERIDLGQGEEAFIGPYYVRVERVYRRGIPGELSRLAIGRLSTALTKEMILESAKPIMSMRMAWL